MEGKRKLFVVGGVALALIIIAGAVYLIYSNYLVEQADEENVHDFLSCVEAGYPVMESYPRQCSAGGEVYVEEINEADEGDSEPICTDMCGDGVCQEIVCLGTGCPCPETPESCPEDCSGV